MEPTAIVRNDNVRDKFIQIYEAMWTPSTGTSGEAAYERESRNFNRLLSEKEDVRKTCTKFSLFTAFLDVAISGLTLDPGTKAQAYLLARSVAVDSYYDNGQKKMPLQYRHGILVAAAVRPEPERAETFGHASLASEKQSIERCAVHIHGRVSGNDISASARHSAGAAAQCTAV